MEEWQQERHSILRIYWKSFFFFFLQAWAEESHFIGNDCGNERKWDEIEIRPGGGEDGRVTENPEIGGKKGEGEEVAKSEPL